jgi:hypothetical protein
MKISMATSDAATTPFTERSGSATVRPAPSAEVTTVTATSGATSGPPIAPARAKRAVAEALIHVMANMFVATAVRGARPKAMSAGT